MKKLHSFTLLVLLFAGTSSLLLAQDARAQLSMEEKLSDFEYLYAELKASYPYFEINKRKYGVDWLGSKATFIEKIEATEDDKAYVRVMQEIVGLLRNGHTDLYPTILYDYFYEGYRRMQAERPALAPMVAELERFDAKNKVSYWQQLLKEIAAAEDGEVQDVAPVPRYNGVRKTIVGNTLIVHMPSFSYERIEIDGPVLATIFQESHEYDNLVLDIQGNGGGDESYWQEHIVAHLIEDRIYYPIVLAFKSSERLARFKPGYVNNLTYQDLNLPNLPPELSTGAYLFNRDTSYVDPSVKGKTFNGKVYLLVDDQVYSSAEALAYFCKVSGFAEVVGQTTSGDGIGTDPLILTLPYSGLVLRFTGEMGLNPDGSANEETQTVPDVILPGDTQVERLQVLLDRIEGE